LNIATIVSKYLLFFKEANIGDMIIEEVAPY